MAWTEGETKVLLHIWADEKIQNQLEGQKRNKLVSNRIVAELLATAGVARMWQQCKVKIKNRVQKFRKVNDVYGETGRCRVPFVFMMTSTQFWKQEQLRSHQCCCSLVQQRLKLLLA